MHDSGIVAFEEWNKSRKMMVKVGSRFPNYQALYVLWILKIIDVIFVKIIDFLIFISKIFIFIILQLHRIKVT